MNQLHSVVLSDAGWIVSLLAGLIIESRLTRAAQRRRKPETFETPGPSWLSAAGCRSLINRPQTPLSDDYELSEKKSVIRSNVA
jgi:hypothetical protein